MSSRLLLVRAPCDVQPPSSFRQTRRLAPVAEGVLYVLVVVHGGVDVVQGRPEGKTLPCLAPCRRRLGLDHSLLLSPVELLPAESVDEH